MGKWLSGSPKWGSSPARPFQCRDSRPYHAVPQSCAHPLLKASRVWVTALGRKDRDYCIEQRMGLGCTAAGGQGPGLESSFRARHQRMLWSLAGQTRGGWNPEWGQEGQGGREQGHVVQGQVGYQSQARGVWACGGRSSKAGHWRVDSLIIN